MASAEDDDVSSGTDDVEQFFLGDVGVEPFKFFLERLVRLGVVAAKEVQPTAVVLFADDRFNANKLSEHSGLYSAFGVH